MSSPLCAIPGAPPGAPPAPATPSPAAVRRAEGTTEGSTDSADAARAIPTFGQELRRIYANLVFLR